MGKQLTITLDDDEAATLEATSKGKDIQVHAKSILLSAASKHKKKAEVDENDSRHRPRC